MFFDQQAEPTRLGCLCKGDGACPISGPVDSERGCEVLSKAAFTAATSSYVAPSQIALDLRSRS